MKHVSPFLHALLIGALLLLSSGCAWYAPADQTRAFAPAPASAADPTHWPARCTDRLHQIIDMAPDLLSVRVKYDTLVDGRVVKMPRRLPAHLTQFSGLYGRGIIRFYRPGPGEPQAISAGMCFFSGVEADSQTARRRSAVRDQDGPDPWVVNLRGTWMRLDEPTRAGPTRGLVVHLTSYGGYRYEEPVIEELRSRGWAVLWVDSSTVRPESTTITVDPDNPEPAATAIARNVSDRISEIAYAVEAGIDFIQKERPDIPTAPLVLCGYSAGSLCTPTVAALIQNRVDACVLVGSGCNLLDVSQRSALTDGGLKLHWLKRTPSRADTDRLDALYLEHCRLDPYWTSRALRDRPVLMLHAVFDSIVPASDGDLLYKHLGRPERVNFLLGHELLFFRLPSHAKLIADWLDDRTAQ